MKLTRKQVERYIELFEDCDYADMLREQLSDNNIKWYIVNNKGEDSKYWGYLLYNTIGYEDVFDEEWLETIIGLPTEKELEDIVSDTIEMAFSKTELIDRIKDYYGINIDFRTRLGKNLLNRIGKELDKYYE